MPCLSSSILNIRPQIIYVYNWHRYIRTFIYEYPLWYTLKLSLWDFYMTFGWPFFNINYRSCQTAFSLYCVRSERWRSRLSTTTYLSFAKPPTPIPSSIHTRASGAVPRYFRPFYLWYVKRVSSPPPFIFLIFFCFHFPQDFSLIAVSAHSILNILL